MESASPGSVAEDPGLQINETLRVNRLYRCGHFDAQVSVRRREGKKLNKSREHKNRTMSGEDLEKEKSRLHVLE